MAKLIKNLHWFIIAYAAFNFYLLYETASERLLSLESEEARVRTILSKYKKTAREIENYYKNIDEEKNKIERVALEIEKTQQLLPSEISDSENINLIKQMADDLNIKEISISPEKDLDKGFLIARKYNIKIKATFLQFLILFEKIGENKRIFNINEVGFKKPEQIQRGKFQLLLGNFVLEAYKYNANYKEERGINEIEASFKKDKPAPPKKENHRPKNSKTEEV